jgi:putative NADH-flavin reductase
MKVAIFGSTGSVGRHLVEQALEQEHTVTAFARDPAKLDIENPNLTKVQGDALDPASVEKAVDGQDAVLCALGAGAKGEIRKEGTRNIVRAMEKAGVSRLICLSSLGVGDSRDSLNFFWKHVMFGLLLRGAYADHVSQENSVKESRLNWTLVRPAAFTDGDHTGEYRHGFPGADKTIKAKISRADVADFMPKQLTDQKYLKETPGLSY